MPHKNFFYKHIHHACISYPNFRYHTFMEMHSEFNLESWVRAYPFSIPVEDPRHRTHGQRDESQEGISPSEPERGVHFWAGQRQECTNEGAKNGVCCNGGGGVDGKGVDKVGLDWHLNRVVRWVKKRVIDSYKCSEESNTH